MMLRAVPGSLPCIRMLSLALALLVIADLLLFENLYSWPSKQQPKFGVDLENLIRTETAEAPNKQQREKKSHIILFVGILNKISLHSRRSAIRSTWMSQCYRNEVVCKFFTDPIEILSGANLTRFKDELATNGDMISMPYTGGNNFSLRLLWMFKWIAKHHTFDFFLRIDDDHFLCLDRLLFELPSRPKQSLYWGFVHCRERIVRVDEGWLMLTSDLVEEVLSKLNTTLQCHPFADQVVASWMIESRFNVTYFYDNDRIINRATAFKVREYLVPDLCDRYLSLHGSYPKFMRMYWNVTRNKREQKTRQYNVPTIPRYSDRCQYSNKIFDFNNFWPQYRFGTKPCKSEPRWSNSDDDFPSREDVGEDD